LHNLTDTTYLRGVFNELRRHGLWNKPNPLSTVRRLKVDERELSFLTEAQIKELLDALKNSESQDVHLVARVCLSTGARWSEAVRLRKHQVKNGRIDFTGTKNGKNRAVPISRDLEAELLVKLEKPDGRLFGDCMKAFRLALKKTSIRLPRGQATHVLRHTFASHFMMNGGNILTLQRILGHQSLTMTMRYAHLSPEHLEGARKFNPLSRLTQSEIFREKQELNSCFYWWAV